jgi:hypothetical protein
MPRLYQGDVARVPCSKRQPGWPDDDLDVDVVFDVDVVVGPPVAVDVTEASSTQPSRSRAAGDRSAQQRR